MKFTTQEKTVLDTLKVNTGNIFSVTYKTEKTEKKEVNVINLHLALLPYTRYNEVYKQLTGVKPKKQVNLCAYADGCKSVCLETCGMNVFKTAINAKYRRTQLFLNHTDLFFKVVIKKIIATSTKHPDKKILVRLNTLSDVLWENIPVMKYNNIFDYFSTYKNVSFYDYTKYPNRNTPDNYTLMYSHNASTYKYFANMEDIFKNYKNIACVFRNKLPKTYKGYKVIDGDLSDYNTKYNKVVIGLLAKGKAKKDTSGFVLK